VLKESLAVQMGYVLKAFENGLVLVDKGEVVHELRRLDTMSKSAFDVRVRWELCWSVGCWEGEGVVRE
jgi:hypothetical protein